MAKQVVTEVEVCGDIKPIGVLSTDFVITNEVNPETGEKYTLTEYLDNLGAVGVEYEEDTETLYFKCS